MAKILLVEDDKNLALSICDFLSAEGNTIEHAATGEDGLQLLECFDFELVILDWQLPGIDGLEVCRRLRRRNFKQPILFLTALGDVPSSDNPGIAGRRPDQCGAENAPCEMQECADAHQDADGQKEGGDHGPGGVIALRSRRIDAMR